MKGARLIAALALLLLCQALALGAPMTLYYQGRYNCQSGQVDHLLTALQVGPNRAIIAGYEALALVDPTALPVGGTQSYICRITGLNARNLYQTGNYIFVNLHSFGTTGIYGFAVVRLNGDVLEYVKTVYEYGIFYEKMCIVGNYLYIACHSNGICVYNIADATHPTKIGALTTGFTDAFDITVSGTTAYVADGAGGLKIVDVADPTHPVLLSGENVQSGVGTYEAITAKDGKVYACAGYGGLAVYDGTNLASRRLIPTGGFAEDLCWVGNYLAVSTYPGPVVFDVSGTDPVIVASEKSLRRGSNATLRINCGIGAADGSRLMVANWNYVDVYLWRLASQTAQSDINCTTDRIRFNLNGGTTSVTISNNGTAALNVGTITSSATSFTTDFSGNIVLQPGESRSFNISYNGGYGTGTIRIPSNDPDENPMPIQVFGNTSYLDPGEPAVDFTMPVLYKDDTGQFQQGSFTLSDKRGKVVWYSVYGTW